MKSRPVPQKRTISVYDYCTVDGCGRTLHSIREGEIGICSSCWFKQMPKGHKAGHEPPDCIDYHVLE